MAVLDEILKELAGPAYEQLTRSKPSAMAHFNHTDAKVRIAAIRVCDRLWNGSADPAFIEACRRMAATDADDFVCGAAVDTLANAFEATQDPSVSHFLAGIASDHGRSERVRKAAYFALRLIQNGLTELEMTLRLISSWKEGLDRLPGELDEERMKRSLFANGHLPASLWDTADQIDWDFVDRFMVPHREASR